MKRAALLIGMMGLSAAAWAADVMQGPVVQLWPPEKVPMAKGTAPADIPTMTVYLPPAEKANGTGVLVCPGGGYQNLAMDHEGVQIARWLNDRGVAAFVLKYRLGPTYHHPVELGDAQRAMHLIRRDAEKYRILGNRIGIWGFSAGGHLAASVSTHLEPALPASDDPLGNISSRPDFAILAYPVITLEPPLAHMGSRRNLLGEDADPKLVELMSNEKQVTAQTPPTFLFHTVDDKAVPVENSVMYFTALRKNNIQAEMHLYQNGPHGVGLADGEGRARKDPILATWSGRLEDWLRHNGWLTKP